MQLKNHLDDLGNLGKIPPPRSCILSPCTYFSDHIHMYMYVLNRQTSWNNVLFIYYLMVYVLHIYLNEWSWNAETSASCTSWNATKPETNLKINPRKLSSEFSLITSDFFLSGESDRRRTILPYETAVHKCQNN